MTPSMRLKLRFSHIFLRRLFRIKNRKPILISPRKIHQRSRKIKMAAYSSMARAVGTRRAWSRAILFKLRSRARIHCIMRKRWFGVKKKKRVVKKNLRGEVEQAEKLRRLVPGGENMEFCEFLEETAHYIKCLAIQVKVMQSIADLYSP